MPPPWTRRQTVSDSLTVYDAASTPSRPLGRTNRSIIYGAINSGMRRGFWSHMAAGLSLGECAARSKILCDQGPPVQGAKAFDTSLIIFVAIRSPKRVERPDDRAIAWE